MTGPSTVRLVSGQGRAAAFALISRLCAQAPGAVVGSLVPAIARILPASGDASEFGARVTGEALSAVVPAYCAHADSVGLSLIELFGSFLDAVDNTGREMDRSRRLDLHSHFVEALLSIPQEEVHGDAIASFLVSCLAWEAFGTTVRGKGSFADGNGMEEESNSDAATFCAEVLRQAPGKERVTASLQLVRCASHMMEMINFAGDNGSTLNLPDQDGFFRIPSRDIAKFALEGTWAKGTKIGKILKTPFEHHGTEKQKSLLRLTLNILATVEACLSSPAVKKVIRSNKGTEANQCLQLWQELMQMWTVAGLSRSAQTNKSDQNTFALLKEFWETAPTVVGNCLDLIQRLLPVSHFLAALTSLMHEEDGNEALLVRSSQLLSGRVSEIDPNSAEASLFLEIVPNLVDLISEAAGSRRAAVVQQAALLAIEKLAHSLCLKSGDEKMLKSRSSYFTLAMERVTVLLNIQAKKVVEVMQKEGATTSDISESQLLSTAALCASTLISVLKTRCLPLLSKLLTPLISSLSSANSFLGKQETQGKDHIYQSAKLLQLSIVRTLLSVVENLSQFVVPFLDMLLLPAGLPSPSLRQSASEDDVPVLRMTERLDDALAKRTPARQLIPVACKAVAQCLKGEGSGCEEAQAVLSLLKSSIQGISKSELSPVVGKILNAVVTVFSFSGDEDKSANLQLSANETLLALVMKLSEAQLRPLYARLREWRGEFSEENQTKTTYVRRHAFWSLSAALSIELRSIFLPCLSSVLDDIVSELEFAASKLCNPTSANIRNAGRKRQKLEVENESLKPLQPLLLCLESAFKADAHEGGGWIRGNDGKRYNMILEPLGKLLQAKIPHGIPLQTSVGTKEASSISSYEKLVQGTGTVDHGNVVGCLAALATAAGNEQFWKPLNHSLLDACSNEERAEVRKAGISGLLSVIQTLGEEYMVLLPECLPILSELLEDEDEEIAALAKECITQGEELLGESLEDAIS